MPLTRGQISCLFKCFARSNKGPPGCHREVNQHFLHWYYHHPTSNRIIQLAGTAVHTPVWTPCVVPFLPCGPCVATQCNSACLLTIDCISVVREMSGGVFTHIRDCITEPHLSRCSLLFRDSGTSFQIPSEFPLCWGNSMSTNQYVYYNAKDRWLAELHLAVIFLMARPGVLSIPVYQTLFGFNQRPTRQSTKLTWILQTPQQMPFLRVECLHKNGILYTAIDEEGVRHSCVKLHCSITKPISFYGADAKLLYDFSRILGWTGPHHPGGADYIGCQYNLQLQWATGEISEEPFDQVWRDAKEATCEFFRNSSNIPTCLRRQCGIWGQT
jgi:hypothetical protein